MKSKNTATQIKSKPGGFQASAEVPRLVPLASGKYRFRDPRTGSSYLTTYDEVVDILETLEGPFRDQLERELFDLTGIIKE
jgi:hypothetical protein